MSARETNAGGVSFQRRLFGFDREEVLAFVSNLLSEYQEAVKKLEHLKGEPAPDQKKRAAHAFQHEETARLIEQTLENAHHRADEIRAEAEQKAARLLADAETRASGVIDRADEIRVEAEQKAARLLADAETRANGVIDRADVEARRRVDARVAHLKEIDQEIEKMRQRHAELRSSLESTLATLGETLTQISMSHANEALDDPQTADTLVRIGVLKTGT